MKFKTLLPYAVADSVSREHSDMLVVIAETIYKKNEQFRKRITDTAIGRDRLYMYMQHWLDAYNKTGKWLIEVK